jgi:hypothetical protein
MAMWLDILKAEDSLLGFKQVDELPDPTLGLEPKLFYLMIQTPFQRKIYKQYGGNLMCIDGTHNTTHYNNTLGTVCAPASQCVAHCLFNHMISGFPVSYMIASHGQTDTLRHYFRAFRTRSPGVFPARVVTDRDLAQINAISAVWMEPTIQLCWWHVLHAWGQHINIIAFKEVWGLLQMWIRDDTAEKFDATWAKIKDIAPTSFSKYLEEYWIPGPCTRFTHAVYIYLMFT